MTERSIVYMPVEDLPSAVRNPKIHSDEMVGSVSRFGFVEPMTLDERTGRLVSGHGRRDELLRRQTSGEAPPEGVMVADDGTWLAPVTRGWASRSDAEAEAFVVAANRIGERGGWDDSLLADVLVDLRGLDGGLDGVGYDDAELNLLLQRLGRDVDVSAHQRHIGPPDDENIPGEPADPVTRRGDVWLLGPHRVMCGDARDADDVAVLLDGATVNVAFTSPPYADRRDYDESSGFRPIDPDQYVAWFQPVAALVGEHLADDGSWFVNIKAGADGLDTNLYVLDLVIAHVRSWGWHFATEFCWERGGMPQQVVRRFKNQFEPVFQFAHGDWKIRPMAVAAPSEHVPIPLGPGGGDTSWNPKATMSNADAQGSPGYEWFRDRNGPGMAYPGNRLPTFAGTHEATGHGAAFPVGLPAWFARAYSDPGDAIYDPFIGSGSTILAAENEGRVGYGMELSPAYVDVTLARWQRKTGIAPVLAATGEARDFHTED